MKTLNAPDTISGKAGRAYAKINGNNEELFFAKTIEATVEKNGKGKKIRIFKYNPKKGYRKRQGHRQPYTKVEIGKISV